MDERPVTSLPIKRTEDFHSNYANNIRYESTVFDLKFLFGVSDQNSGTEIIEQHTGITVPWAVVKLAVYYMQVQLLVQEINNGKIILPPNQIPPPPPDSLPGVDKKDPAFKTTREAILKLREQFIAGL